MKTEFRHVLPHEVKDFILNQFSSPEIKRSIITPGKVMYNMINQLEKHPLFFYNGTAEARLSFSSWYGALDLRQSTYKTPLARDLYLLHELNHMATLMYQNMTDEEWMVEHIRNEKASSFWSEALVYFEYPSLFDEAGSIFKDLWVTQFFNDQICLIPGVSNHVLYAQSSELCSALMFQEFIKISVKDFNALSSAEKRSRKYDYLTETWCDANKCLQKSINRHFISYLELINENNEMQAIDLHKNWLVENVSERGVLFDDAHILRKKCDSKEIFKLAKKDARFKNLQLKFSIPYTLSLQYYLDNIVKTMNSEETKGNITPTALVSPSKELIQQAGITSTVYSLFTQPARKATNEIYSMPNIQDKLYGMAASRIQDGYNNMFINQYKYWTKNLVTGLDDFAYAYPTSGSSEALRESMIELAANAQSKADKVRVHIFQGEYEGVRAYADSVKIPIIEHCTRDLNELLISDKLKANDIFYISYPSSIDGNIWPDLNSFLDLMQQKGVRVLLDLAYVGTYLGKQQINANHPAIECVYFSLSKSFGVYYQRVGGVFSRTPINLLVGNKWFKNTFSMTLGSNLMQRFDHQAIPKFYSHIQKALVWYVNSIFNINLQPSDVFLIANQKITQTEYSLLTQNLKTLCRANNNEYVLRACLQPLYDYLTNEFSRTFPLFDFDLKIRASNHNKIKSCSSNLPEIEISNSDQITVSGWEKNGHLTKLFPMPNKQASSFLEDILAVSNKLNHHPRITIADNNCVISLITHATNSITKMDVKLATEIDHLHKNYDTVQSSIVKFSEANNAGNISKSFTFKNFERAFDFAKNIRALATNIDLKKSRFQIDWGVCTVFGQSSYLEKATNIYRSLGNKEIMLKHRAKL